MRKLFATLLALNLIGGVGAGEVAAAKKQQAKRDHYSRHTHERSYGDRPIRDFDETQYYERLSERIPFGSAAWWRQKQLENPAP